MKNIVIIFGGKSPEHEVSIVTGVLTLNALKKTEYNAVPVYVDEKGDFYTGDDLFDLDNFQNLNYKKLIRVTFLPNDNTLYKLKSKKLVAIYKISALINCCHGGDGENGNLSGLIESLGVALCSPDALSSALFMDKELTKIALKGLGVRCLPCVTTSDLTVTEKDVYGLGFPLIIKPISSGSSVGIKEVQRYEDLPLAISYALKYSKKAVIEPRLKDFTEINCAVYKNSKGELIVSNCEKPISRTGILSFNDKYVLGEREFPANISTSISNRIKNIAKTIYKTFISLGVIRIDFFIYDGKIFVNEVNTVPGSLSYYLFCDTINDFSKMLTELIKTGEKEFNQKNQTSTVYKSGILTTFGTKGSKRL